MNACSDCDTAECAERRACQRRNGAISDISSIQPVWPLYPRRIEPPQANDAAQSINAYNARVSAAVDAMLTQAARWAVGLVGGCVLFAYVLNAVWGPQ